MIKKKCKCSPGCNLWPTIGFEGYNVNHHPDPTLKDRKIAAANDRKKVRTAIKGTGARLRKEKSEDNKLLDNQAKANFEKQQLWFHQIMGNELNVCWETGETIQFSYMRAAVAHILPKKAGRVGAIGGFASVATHPLNYMILSPTNGSHNKYDQSWESAQSMKVWKRAVARFIEIYPAIAPAERKYIPDCLLQWIEPDHLI